ncbi:hypothetical protein D3C75_919930 [compost metagenome]
MHIHGTTVHPFHVDQIDGSNVLRYRVASIRSAAKCERRDIRIVKVADGAMCRRRVHKNTSRLQAVRELHDNFFIVGVDSRTVAHAAKFNDFCSTFDTLVSIFNFVASQNRAQLLSGQRIFSTYTFDFCYQNLSACRNLDSAHFSDFHSRLTNDCRVYCAFFYIHSAVCQLSSFIFVNEVAAVRDHFLFHLVKNCFFNNNGLLGSTDHTVVK